MLWHQWGALRCADLAQRATRARNACSRAPRVPFMGARGHADDWHHRNQWFGLRAGLGGVRMARAPTPPTAIGRVDRLGDGSCRGDCAVPDRRQAVQDRNGRREILRRRRGNAQHHGAFERGCTHTARTAPSYQSRRILCADDSPHSHERIGSQERQQVSLWLQLRDCQASSLVAGTLAWVVLGAWVLYAVRQRRDGVVLALCAILGFNLGLHAIWGTEFFLYSQHWIAAVTLAFMLLRRQTARRLASLDPDARWESASSAATLLRSVSCLPRSSKTREWRRSAVCV